MQEDIKKKFSLAQFNDCQQVNDQPRCIKEKNKHIPTMLKKSDLQYI